MHTVLRFVLLAQIVGALSAGVLLKFETTDHSASQPATTMSKIAVDDDMLSMDSQLTSEMSQPKNSMVFRSATRILYVIDHRRKTYFKLDEQSIGGMADTMDRMMAQMRERMKGMPPKQQAAMRQMLQSRMGAMGVTQPRPKPEIIATGVRDEINGYRCEVYEVKRQGVKEREVCVTDWSDIQGSDELIDVMKGMAKFMEATVAAMRRAVPFGTTGNPLADLNELSGFPVSTKDFNDGKLTSENVLKSVNEQDIDPDTFGPPKGYTGREMRRSTSP